MVIIVDAMIAVLVASAAYTATLLILDIIIPEENEEQDGSEN